MASKYLSSLSDDDYKLLSRKLSNIQSGICFICQNRIDLDIQETNIDHIIPLVGNGKDSEENFAITHASCNKSKQDSNLYIARIIHKLIALQDEIQKNENRAASLKDLLKIENGSKFDFKYKIENDILVYSFSEIGDNTVYKSTIYTDKLSQEKTVFIDIPIEYIHHDSIINPRGINSSISLLIKEFYKKNPQLHRSLARLNDNKIQVFDGQHKAAAQILLGTKKILLRLFIDTNINRLRETNTNVGSSLRQIAFDKSIIRQLNNTLYFDKIKKYQFDHSLSEDCFGFSEAQLTEHFKGENANIKKILLIA